jgi:hypothetical protein
MIVHIVLFKLHDPSAENIGEAVSLLRSMEGKVPMLRHLEVGTDVIRSERSSDVALYTRFDSLEDLTAYQVDPYHGGTVAPRMRALSSSIIAADYEV